MASSKIKGITVEIGGNTTKLGKSDSDIILRQSNDRISFIQNNTEVAYISDSTLICLIKKQFIM